MTQQEILQYGQMMAAIDWRNISLSETYTRAKEIIEAAKYPDLTVDDLSGSGMTDKEIIEYMQVLDIYRNISIG